MVSLTACAPRVEIHAWLGSSKTLRAAEIQTPFASRARRHAEATRSLWQTAPRQQIFNARRAGRRVRRASSKPRRAQSSVIEFARFAREIAPPALLRAHHAVQPWIDCAFHATSLVPPENSSRRSAAALTTESARHAANAKPTNSRAPRVPQHRIGSVHDARSYAPQLVSLSRRPVRGRRTACAACAPQPATSAALSTAAVQMAAHLRFSSLSRALPAQTGYAHSARVPATTVNSRLSRAMPRRTAPVLLALCARPSSLRRPHANPHRILYVSAVRSSACQRFLKLHLVNRTQTDNASDAHQPARQMRSKWLHAVHPPTSSARHARQSAPTVRSRQGRARARRTACAQRAMTAMKERSRRLHAQRQAIESVPRVVQTALAELSKRCLVQGPQTVCAAHAPRCVARGNLK